jgi:hypothetical protein
MKRVCVLFLFLLLSVPSSLVAQLLGPISSEFNSFRQNGISTVELSPDFVWVSPFLNYAPHSSVTGNWEIPNGVDSLTNGVGRVFSMDSQGDTLVVGLGFTSSTPAGNVPAGYGTYISTDQGNEWFFSPFLLDRYINEDTTFEYGGQIYNRQRVIVSEQSPPYSITVHDGVIFSANWASGLLRSPDLGRSWERIILPPFGVKELLPDGTRYNWRNCVSSSGGTCTAYEQLYTAVSDDNLKGFAVMIDRHDRVWYGSAGGINISDNALKAPLDSIRWRNVGFNYDPDGLLARWVIEIAEDPNTGYVWLTNWIAEGSGSNLQGLDNYGVVYSKDGGLSFEQRLHGEKILSIGFFRGSIYAAGEQGLFISSDGGNTWEMNNRFKTQTNLITEKASFQSIASNDNYLFIGTSEGLLWTEDPEGPWNIERVNFPLTGGNNFEQESSNVSSYAYPNPYSPDLHGQIRIRFDSSTPENAQLRIFDFSNTLVYETTEQTSSTGGYEILWNGYNMKGHQVDNGVYFYQITLSNKTLEGKILVIH